jgi:hypothetical protein
MSAMHIILLRRDLLWCQNACNYINKINNYIIYNINHMPRFRSANKSLRFSGA